MPIVQIHLLEGRDTETKRKLVSEVCRAVGSALNRPPETVHVIISDLAPDSLALNGELVIDKKK
jgi:4-oxalocrotonate tautomerase